MFERDLFSFGRGEFYSWGDDSKYGGNGGSKRIGENLDKVDELEEPVEFEEEPRIRAGSKCERLEVIIDGAGSNQ
jgi:hypothetical protein